MSAVWYDSDQHYTGDDMELQSAVERLYADESLAADVDDTTAKPLLKWAEELLPAVITTFGDTGFDDAFVTLKKLVKSVGRLIDMRGEMDETERAERVEKIQAFAQELGVIVDISRVENLASETGPAIVAQVLGSVENQALNLEAFSLSAESKSFETAAPPISGRSTEPAAAADNSQTPAPEPARKAAPATAPQPPDSAPVEAVVGSSAPQEQSLSPAEAVADAANAATPQPDGIQSLFRRFIDKLTGPTDSETSDNADNKE